MALNLQFSKCAKIINHRQHPKIFAISISHAKQTAAACSLYSMINIILYQNNFWISGLETPYLVVSCIHIPWRSSDIEARSIISNPAISEYVVFFMLLTNTQVSPTTSNLTLHFIVQTFKIPTLKRHKAQYTIFTGLHYKHNFQINFTVRVRPI